MIVAWHVPRSKRARGRQAVWSGLGPPVDERNLPTTKGLLFIQQEGEWSLQEMLDYIWVGDGPTMVPIEEVVGPPPGD